MMPHLLGAIFALCGVYLLISALRHRARSLQLRALLGDKATENDESPLDGLGDIMSPIINVSLGFLAVMFSFTFFAVGDRTTFSVFDLGGLLFLMLAYGISTSIRVRHTKLARLERLAADLNG